MASIVEMRSRYAMFHLFSRLLALTALLNARALQLLKKILVQVQSVKLMFPNR